MVVYFHSPSTWTAKVNRIERLVAWYGEVLVARLNGWQSGRTTMTMTGSRPAGTLLTLLFYRSLMPPSGLGIEK
jgi:hypothetical protein